MSKNENLEDRFMDELLREDAQGSEVDEQLLQAVEAAMESEGQDREVGTVRHERSRAPFAWAAMLTVSAASVLGYLGWKASQGRESITEPLVMEAPSPVFDALESRRDILKPDLSAHDPFGLERPGAAAPQNPAMRKEESSTVMPMSAKMLRPVPSSTAPGQSAESVAIKGGIYTSGGRAPNSTRGGVRREVPLEGEAWGDQAPEKGGFGRNAAPVDRERYGQLVDQPWKTPKTARFSTFSVDVDTASYTNIRRMVEQGATISPDAVRIEECLNYFDYQYAPPTKGGPFAVHTQVATCPWAPEHRLMRVGIKGMEVPNHKRPVSNLVFLIDVSGSMQDSTKLPLLVESMKILVEELDQRDRVSMVVYAGAEGVVLNPTQIDEDGRGALLAALNQLRSGGSTNGGAGIKRAYQLAEENFVEGGVNRVILATDGDFNVGTTSQGDLVRLVKERAGKGIYLSVLGFGSGNLNDGMLEAITNDGNGNYYYIDSQKEGRKVFLQNLTGTLVTIAKDVKIQVDFNPAKVQAYRLIGYANRILRDEDFNNDKVDAGDIGAGHTVTALYEIVPVGAPMPPIGGVDASKFDAPAAPDPAPAGAAHKELLWVKLRYKHPDGDKSKLLEAPVADETEAWAAAGEDFQFAAGVALFGMKLRDSQYANDAGWDLVKTLGGNGSKRDVHGYRAEFLTLVDKLAAREAPPVPVDPLPPGVEALPAE